MGDMLSWWVHELKAEKIMGRVVLPSGWNLLKSKGSREGESWEMFNCFGVFVCG